MRFRIKSILLATFWTTGFLINPGYWYLAAFVFLWIGLVTFLLSKLFPLKTFAAILSLARVNHFCMALVTIAMVCLSYVYYLNFYYPPSSGLAFGSGGVEIDFYFEPYDRQSDGFERVRIGAISGMADIKQTWLHFNDENNWFDLQISNRDIGLTLCLSAVVWLPFVVEWRHTYRRLQQRHDT